MVPLFNEVAIGLGASASFATVYEQAKNLDISSALATMQGILFGSQN
jgi:hypothetical protein